MVNRAAVIISKKFGLSAEQKKELVKTASGGELSNELFAILFRGLVTEMPYEVAKAKSTDPSLWIKKWVTDNIGKLV